MKCSTPIGITGTRTFTGGTPATGADLCCSTPIGITGTRTTIPARSGLARASAQRRLASRGRERSTEFVASVVFFSAQRRLASRGRELHVLRNPDGALMGCSTPIGITGTRTTPEVPEVLPRFECSTPIGITGTRTTEGPVPKRAGLVLNADWHHGDENHAGQPSNNGAKTCSTPIGITGTRTRTGGYALGQ